MTYENLLQDPLGLMLLICGLLLGLADGEQRRRVSGRLGALLGLFLGLQPLWIALLSPDDAAWIEPGLLGMLLGLAGANWANFFGRAAGQMRAQALSLAPWAASSEPATAQNQAGQPFAASQACVTDPAAKSLQPLSPSSAVARRKPESTHGSR